MIVYIYLDCAQRDFCSNRIFSLSCFLLVRSRCLLCAALCTLNCVECASCTILYRCRPAHCAMCHAFVPWTVYVYHICCTGRRASGVSWLHRQWQLSLDSVSLILFSSADFLLSFQIFWILPLFSQVSIVVHPCHACYACYACHAMMLLVSYMLAPLICVHLWVVLFSCFGVLFVLPSFSLFL